ncbi:MerR family transcriptional regulator [Ligaoa zhengdingensis]|uniref:MerR family transcriptional regulator n=1 Tax=Ligaoa zhengdingensis TaxID=2763658 RepID=UPI0031BA51D6
MKRTVKQVADLCGVSVRALHHYDQIGLLHPAETTPAGYRLYGDEELARLQQILFFRELEFPLKEIQRILDNPSFDEHEALTRHRALLILKRERLNGLIRLVDQTLKGESEMSFAEFDTTEIEAACERYADEARQRWSGTDAYRESAERTKHYQKEDWARINAEADQFYRALASQMGRAPSDPSVQKLVSDWQALITRYYYPCTDEILAGLGEMYIADRRFTDNIDRYAPGLARFLSDAIAIHCGQN